MSSFEITRSQFNQQHFTVVEIDLPVVNGTCTISNQPGYGTPLSCDQSSDGIKTYKFTDVNAPILPESDILRVIKSISETPAKLQQGKGLASRGTASISSQKQPDNERRNYVRDSPHDRPRMACRECKYSKAKNPKNPAQGH